jgi:5-methylcytosine-specific restriction endonuclease McrA
MPDAPTVDHIIPLAKGGTHTWDNVQLAHWSCNSDKRDIIVTRAAKIITACSATALHNASLNQYVLFQL